MTIKMTDAESPLNVFAVECDEYSKSDCIAADQNRQCCSKPFRRQLLACSSSIFGAICFGMCTGVTTTMLDQMAEQINIETGSWLASAIVLTMPFGNLVSSFTMRHYGRRFSLIVFPLVWLFAWLYTSMSDDFWSLLFGCCLIGFGAGLNSTVNSLYYAETCQPNLRGFFLGVIGSSTSSGILLSHSLGIFLPWRWAFRMCAAAPTLSFLTSFYALESPSWLILKGRVANAKENFFWLRCRTTQSEKEFAELLERRMENDRINRRGLLANIFSKKFFKPFSILALLFAVQQGSGLNVVIFYTVQMVKKISANIDARMCTILIDIVRVFSSITGCLLLKWIDRRVVYFLSSSCTFLWLVIIVLSIVNDFPPFVVVISLSCYIFSMSGITMIPWLMNSELYPAILRDVGSLISLIFAFLLKFVFVKTGPLLFSLIGMPFTLSMYASIVLIGSIALYFHLPETKNITLQEAEDKIARKV